MSDHRINQTANTRTAANILVTDVFPVEPTTGGAFMTITFAELLKAILGGDITAGTALESAAVILDASKKITGIGGIKMISTYEPTVAKDVVTKDYIDNTILNEDYAVLMKMKEVAYSDLTSGVAYNIMSLPAGTMVLGIYIFIKTAFTDSGTDLLKVGVTSDDDYFEADTDISGTGWITINDASYPYKSNLESITITYTGQNGDADAGGMEIYIKYAKF